MIKKINILCKHFENYSGSNFESKETGKKRENNNIDNLIKDLIKLAPNKEERQRLMDDLKQLTDKQKEELQKFYNDKIKPLLNELKEHIIDKEFYKKLKEKIKELYDKIKELKEKEKKSPKDKEKLREYKVIVTLLKKSEDIHFNKKDDLNLA